MNQEVGISYEQLNPFEKYFSRQFFFSTSK